MTKNQNVHKARLADALADIHGVLGDENIGLLFIVIDQLLPADRQASVVNELLDLNEDGDDNAGKLAHFLTDAFALRF